MSFEEAIAELEKIVKRLESGQVSLEQAIDDYVHGSKLRAHCEKKLKDARLRVEKIIKTEAGEITTEPV